MLSKGLRDASSTVEGEGEDEDAAFIPRSGIHDRSVGFTSQKEFAGTKMKIVKVKRRHPLMGCVVIVMTQSGASKLDRLRVGKNTFFIN